MHASTKKRSLSKLGMAFAALAVVAVFGLMLLLNYDTLVQGHDENSIGDTQMMYVYMAIVGVIVCIMVVGVDFMKNRAAS
jgi:cell division protein FtsW (lipid II flippase)